MRGNEDSICTSVVQQGLAACYQAGIADGMHDACLHCPPLCKFAASTAGMQLAKVNVWAWDVDMQQSCLWALAVWTHKGHADMLQPAPWRGSGQWLLQTVTDRF